MSITIIGTVDWRTDNRLFGIKSPDRLFHTYVIGKTGSGKSSLLLNMLKSDILQGQGVGIIEPHSDLSGDLLNLIPLDRIQDVVYLNVSDTEYPIGFNPLANITEENRYLVVESIVIGLKKFFDSWGPRMEYLLRNTLQTLSYNSKSTLLDIVPLLTNIEFRKQVLYSVSDSSLHEFWQKEFAPLSPQLKNEFIAPILNKVSLFTTHPVIRNIVGQNRSSFNAFELMNLKKIFIGNLSKAILGEAGCSLLGSLLITQFQIAALARSNQPIGHRIPFQLFIDEAQNFITKTVSDILSECRKYGLGIVISHQFLDQMPEEIQNSIIGNVGTLITFKVGTRDAKRLSEEYNPVFSETDLINLPKYHIYLKLMIDGTTSKPFSAITLPVKRVARSYKDDIVAFSRKMYGSRKEAVEEELQNVKRNKTEVTNLFS